MRNTIAAILCFTLLLVPLSIGFAQQKQATAEKKTAAKTTSEKKTVDTKTADKKGEKKGKAAKPPKFLRLRRDTNKKKSLLAMETSIVTYKLMKGDQEVAVDLIGVVHIGEKTYYDKLNKIFESYEVLLYELVAPPGTRIPKGGRKGPNTSLIGNMQTGMQSMLGLAYQLNHIDYTKKNFVHADMSPDEFNKTMKNRGESWLQMFFKMMGQGMAMQAKGGTSDLELLMAMMSRDKTNLRRILARQFENMEGSISALDGPKGSTIISERNRKAFEVLRQQLDAGKKRIGVFYGAGHLPDMEKRLYRDFKMKRVSEKWLVAWDLTGQKKKSK